MSSASSLLFSQFLNSHIYHGSLTGISSAPVFTATGESADDCFGCAVSAAGDINGDGYADVVISAPGYISDTGKVYVYHGSVTGLGSTPVFSATGESAGDVFGLAVGMAGDMNGDGYADLAVGAPYRDVISGTDVFTDVGKVYVYYGGSMGVFTQPAAWAARGENVDDLFGMAVGTAGDINGNGYADLAIGAPGFNSGTGKLYVYHGSPTGFRTDSADWTANGENAVDVWAPP